MGPRTAVSLAFATLAWSDTTYAVDWAAGHWEEIHSSAECPEGPLEEIELSQRPDNRLMTAIELFSCKEDEKKIEAYKVLYAIRAECDGSIVMVRGINVCPPVDAINRE